MLLRCGRELEFFQSWRPKLGVLSALIGAVVLSACAAPQVITYSLQDPEIFSTPRAHPMNVAVVEMEDFRLPDEKDWARRRKLPENLSAALTRRMVDHLQVSGVFNTIRLSPRPFSLKTPGLAAQFIKQGIDVILVGQLEHYYGKSGPDRSIEGRARFTNLKLHSLHTGRILWQGETEKLLRRQEKAPGQDRFYASEALRGALNQLSLQWSDLSFSPLEVYGKDRLPVKRWRVGLMRPTDLRPLGNRSIKARRLQGNRNYLLFRGSIPGDHPCSFYKECPERPLTAVAIQQWAVQLQSSGVFGRVRILENRPVTAKVRKSWVEAGLDVVITSELDRGLAGVVPSSKGEPFPVWSGGMAYPRLFSATAMIRLVDVRVMDARNGAILWKGEAEYTIDRSVSRWESPSRFLQEALSGMLDRLTEELSKSLQLPAQGASPQ